nr:PREDICTED: uncharacterized protein LOC100875325 isoform X2 [Megachile rotundata]
MEGTVKSTRNELRCHNTECIKETLNTVLQLYVAILAKDIDEIIDVLPHIFLVIGSLTKFGNIFLNKERVRTDYFKASTVYYTYFLLQIKILLDRIVRDWKTMGSELHVLDEITATGYRLAHLYRVTLLTFTMIFNYIPLIPPTLDIILPRNESRPRHQLFQVNYVFFDADDHFIFTYLHMFWAGSLTVFVVVTVDSLYMLIIHHASGLFDVCGYQVEMACREEKVKDAMFKQCLITHHKALEFFNLLQACSQSMNLLLVGMNMLLISTTGVQIILYMDRPLDSVRFVLFFLGEHFHLYIISLLGQIVLNHSLLLPEKIYGSNWDDIPIKFQKLLFKMIIRCSRPCILSAGGLYDMNMENYGKVCIAFEICCAWIYVNEQHFLGKRR